MARFETKVCLVNAYGDVVCELEKAGDDCFFYKFPREVLGTLLDVGDVYSVEEIETEVE